MDKCDFFNVEVLDGVFSSVAYICENDRRYIVDIAYDIELENLQLRNSSDCRYNSDRECYSVEELNEIKGRNYYELKNEILLFVREHGDLVFADY